MVDTYIRYAEKFTSADGSTYTQTLPVDDYEFTAEQWYRGSPAAVVGADYAYDLAGSLPWPKDAGTETVRFTIWGTSPANAESQFDTLVSTLRKIGLGLLYTLESDGSTRRWCWARLVGRPSYQSTKDSFYNISVVCTFKRFSDWYGTSQTTGTQAVSASPTSFTITNGGNAPAYPVIRLRASGASGITACTLVNQTNGCSVASSRNSVSANDEIRIDGDAGAIKYSSDDGVTYSNDMAKVTLGAAQRGVMRLEPGSNTLQYSDGGTPSLSVEWSFYPGYE